MGQGYSLAVCVGLPLANSVIGTILNRRGSDKWYKDLKKPKWTPPRWLFGVMDIAFHVSMGTASWFIWKKGFKEQKTPLILYGSQLLLNFLFNPMFYHCHELGCALTNLFLIDILATTAAVMFFKESKTGGSLLVPYVAYAYFCTALTATTLCNEEEAKKEEEPTVKETPLADVAAHTSPGASPSVPAAPKTGAPKVDAAKTAAAAVEGKKTA